MIFTALSPNTQKDDFKLAWEALRRKDDYLEGEYVSKLKDWFSNFLDIENVFTFESGRTGLFNLLQEMKIGQEDEVIVQAFTCVAATNPIKWTGATPVFADINPETFNVDFDDLVNKTTDKTKAVIVQHTFGYPAEIDKIVKYAKENGILVIEDCAHTIGTQVTAKKLGTFGDGALFSLGRDKAVSSSFGGVVVVKDEKLAKNLKQAEEVLKFPSKNWVVRQILYTLISYLTRKFYDKLFLGKLIHFIAFKLGFVNKATTKGEKQSGKKPSFSGSVMPNVFAQLALNQLNKLEDINSQRKKQAKYYMSKLARLKGAITLPKWNLADDIFPLRFPILVKKREELVEYAHKQGLLLGNWYEVPVGPKEVVLHKTGYKWGSCQNAEKVCREVVNLPIHINLTDEDLRKVVNIINSFYSLGSVESEY